MSAAWKPRAGAWRWGERVVHLADPLPGTRDLVAVTLSDYSFRVVTATTRDTGDASWLIESILTGTITTRQIDAIADAVVENIFGQPRWTVTKIWRQTLALWREVDGELGQRGVDLLALAPDRATAVAYSCLRHRHSHNDDALSRWLGDLDQLPDRARDTGADDDAAAADWLAAAAMFGGGAPPMVAVPEGVDSELTFT
ncbi:hypothetical protein [Nocardia sp. NPDC059154]|uniref:hypothetical protein n=1 Tax=Nocardia sp. NPDC059154 TaxID=3346744 RepID=UPI0036B964B8